MAKGADDVLRMLAARAVPGAGQLLDTAQLREVVDELRKGMTGAEEIERRLADVEERLAAVETELKRLSRPQAPRTRQRTTPKHAPQSDSP